MPAKKYNLRVDVKDIFSYDPKRGILFLGGEAMTEQRIKNLQAEIAFIEKTDWWTVCNETMRQLAIEKMVYKSTSYDDMRNGKEMMEILKLMNEMMVVIKQWKKVEIQRIQKPGR